MVAASARNETAQPYIPDGPAFDWPGDGWPGDGWPAPRGIILNNPAWVEDILRRYGLEGLAIPAGAIVLERISATGGRCFCYPDGSWLIGVSLPRLQRGGRRGVEGILAHELLHAWLWSRHRYRGHGPFFENTPPRGASPAGVRLTAKCAGGRARSSRFCLIPGRRRR